MSETKRCIKCGETKPASGEYFKVNIKLKSGFEGKCRKCLAEINREYYREHKEQIKRYHQGRRKETLTYRDAYRKNNLEKFRIYAHKYRERKRKLPCTLTIQQWKKVMSYFDNKCAYCGKETSLEQEHFLPCSKGGELSALNIIPACKSCNCSKNDSKFTEWYPKSKHYSKKREQKILKYLGYTNGIQQLSLI